MPEDKDDDSGFSLGFGRTREDSDSEEESATEDAPNESEDAEEQEENEVDEVRTLEKTLERRERQIDKLKQRIATLENQTEESTDDTVDDAVVEEYEERISELETTVEDLTDERDELQEENDKLKKLVAKRENELKEYRNRMEKREEQARSDAISEVVKELSTVRNTLVMALDQDEGSDIRSGVRGTLDELDETLEEYGLHVIDPSEGDEVDPHRHEVVHRKPSSHENDTIASVFSAGYEYDGRVIEAARVVVSAGEPVTTTEETMGSSSDVEE